MHFLHIPGGIAFCRQVRLDRLVHHRDESDDVAQRHVRRRLDIVHLVFFQASMAQGNFLLIIEPDLIIRPQTRVQNPLLESLVAGRQIVWEWISLGRSGVTGQMRNARDNSTAPALDNLLRLVT